MNSIITSALLLTAAEIVADSLKTKITSVTNWISDQFVVSLEIRSSDEAFEWVEYWLDEQPYSKSNRRLLLTTFKGTQDNGFSSQIYLTPAPGHHVFYYKNNLIWLNRTSDEAQSKGRSNDYESFTKPKESFKLTLFGRSQKIIKELVDDLQETAKRMLKQKPKFYSSIYGSWHDRSDIIQRKVDSVILPNQEEKKIIEDLKWFLDSADWYKVRGIPYRRGYLFHGIPGSGKSSLVTALAGELGLNLYMLNLNAVGMTDDRLLDMIHNIKDRSLILFEDIDVVQPRRDSVTKSNVEKISLSGLLNVIDGPSAREGCAVFMTTNYKDKLDKALIRAGRTDVKLEFSYATPPQIYRFYQIFFDDKATASPKEIERLHHDRNYSMADIQQKFIENREDHDGFLSSLKEGM